MRLKLILPKVEPKKFGYPKKCSQEGCPGKRFIPRQEVSKKIVDAQYREVSAWRYECLECGSTFRVYPEGVSCKQISQRVNGTAVMLYMLGLSYGAVELRLGGLGLSIGKSSVYRAVQAMIGKVAGLSKEELAERKYKTKAVGADVPSN